MNIDLHTALCSLAEHSQAAAELMRAAVCDGCRSCVGEISDINRQTLSELSDLERELFLSSNKDEKAFLSAAHALAFCVNRAFSAAMLLPDGLPTLPPLAEIVCANAALAAYPLRILSHDRELSFYSLHLAANKGRGAHALLITNYCRMGAGQRLFPSVLALERHRDALEQASATLTAL